MTRTANDIAALSPSECWDSYVGNQTVADFLDGSTDPALEAHDYVNGSPLCEDLDADAREALAAKLAEYCER